MAKIPSLRLLLLAPAPLRASFLPQAIPITSISQTRPISTPSIAAPSFWRSLIPKPLRRSPDAPRTSFFGKKLAPKSKVKKPWNPATPFIILFTLIGSMSIQMIALKNSHAAFSRRADAKIGLLREVIGRIQKGEEVDVEGLLGGGTGVDGRRREAEWEDVLREIEEEDQLWKDVNKSKSKHAKSNQETEKDVASTGGSQNATQELAKEDVKKPVRSVAPTGFY